MIPKVTKGSRMHGLMAYLEGPGKTNEHTNPHLVTGSAGVMDWFGDPVLDRDQAHAVARYLERPMRSFGITPKAGHVWHCSLSLRADEGQLSDEKWATIAREFIDGMGFNEGADVRWVAVRHGLSAGGNDHVHLAVNLVREDGSLANIGYDYSRAQATARELERRHGLQQLFDSSQQRGLQAVSRAELETAKRHGLLEPERVRLARIVRAAAAEATDEPTFIAGVVRRGARIRPSWEKGGRDVVRGYAVALRASETLEEPRWFGGGGLDKSVTLPKLRQRWGVSDEQVEAAVPVWRVEAVPTKALADNTLSQWHRAAQELDEAHRRLAATDPQDRQAWAAAAADTAGVFAEWSIRVERHPGPLARASDALARSAQSARDMRRAPIRQVHVGGQQMQLAARSSSRSAWQGWRAVMTQLDRTTRAIHDAHLARDEKVAAARLSVAVGAGLAEVRERLRSVEPSRAERIAMSAARPGPVQDQTRPVMHSRQQHHDAGFER